MTYIYITIMTLISSSWDRWMGDILFFSFPIAFLIVQYLFKDKMYFFSLLYSIIYFASKYDIGLMTIIFFIINVISFHLFEFLEKSYLRSLFSASIPLIFLAFINKNFYVLVISYILLSITHFIIVGRIDKNERITI
ncbi:hypothetical protein SAMN02745164_00978 [Marinitoga hydrogenitolerans DSM 16785]|uniref:Uncharacterized protein n=1 Tax=Marinitoga hydrogenitolerans (strain DSM 16785 / JCM 12826 / AT1271) TaxID=1122195 RepID=A0A1M4VPX5_MARH1|nr:hypothetical protein [Marinitoga hydrogenitolerans]SHE70897.1 hypothetical protein SAMN02745164_00978 [Marinitoga hydrogenitolerans DSM 16785]